MINQNYTDKDLRTIVEEMSDNKIRILVDATYLYHERPGNIVSFKEAFNAQKHRHLTKLHIYASSNGWVFKVSHPNQPNNHLFVFRTLGLGKLTRGLETFFLSKRFC